MEATIPGRGCFHKGMPVRHQYRLEALPDQATPPPKGATLRPPVADDRIDLARLMLDAYLGTIDYDGEGIDEAVAEVAGYLAGSPLLEQSVLAVVDGDIASACLAGRHDGGAIIGYVMTAAAHKGRGLGRLVTETALTLLREAGHDTVDAWITEGNTPSERIFTGLGFRVVA